MSKSDPRIAPKEMIVTRFKSAQQRRQLREKDRTTTTVTQQLKSPAQKRGRRKAQRSPRKEKEDKSSVGVDEDDAKEFYPEKLKRVPGERKQFLKPKHNMKTVASTNKRKRNIPKKGLKSHQHWPGDYSPSRASLKCQSPVYSELSMDEVIRIVEDTESLDEEDLMEILTCPSPVWWEEPASEMYIEEAICSRNPDHEPHNPIKERCLQTFTKQALKKSRRKSRSSKEEPKIEPEDIEEDFKMEINNIANDSSFIITENKDERFNKKRKKLENVLGNIKNKNLSNKSIKTAKINKNQSLIDRIKDRFDIKTSNVVEKVDAKDQCKDKDSKDEEENKYVKVKRISESTEGDIADLTVDDDILLDLENMEIPVEDYSADRSGSSESIIIINDDEGKKITLIDDSDSERIDKCSDMAVLEANPNLDGKVTLLREDISLIIKQELLDAYNDGDNADSCINNIYKDQRSNIIQNPDENLGDKVNILDDKAEIKLIEVPKNLPPLKKRPKIENTAFPSPVSYKSATDDAVEISSVSSHDISDTISDTNIKFIMDDEIDDISDIEIKNDVTITKICKDDNKTDSSNAIDRNEDLKSKDYITVYKIMPNENEKASLNIKLKSIPEYSNHVQIFKKSDAKNEIANDELPDSKGQLNSFYKKCKNVNRKRCKKTDEFETKSVDEKSVCESCEPKKSITVAQDENVKYCLKCSSIFDTEECSYCLKSLRDTENGRNVCDFVADSRSISCENVLDDAKV